MLEIVVGSLRFRARWEAEAYLCAGQSVMTPDQVATEVLHIVRSPAGLDDVVVRAR